MTSFHAPFDVGIQRLQPLLLLDGNVLCPTGDNGSAMAWLISSSGAVVPMKRLYAIDEVFERARRASASAIHCAAQAMMRRTAARASQLPTRQFIEELAPLIEDWDWGPAALQRISPSAQVPSSPQSRQWQPEPHIDVPSPSLVVYGRIWLLAGGISNKPALQVSVGDSGYYCSGSYMRLATVSRRWDDECTRTAATLASELPRAETIQPTPAALLAEHALAARGFLELGDLLLLAGGDGIRIGVILPPHRNTTVGGWCDRTLAVSLRWDAVATPTGSIGMYCKQADGWLPYTPPNGLCLGRSMPATSDHHNPLIGQIAFLRAAAFRIAANGRMHERD